MKKIKKRLLNAVDYLSQNPTATLTKTAKDFQVDRHTLNDYLNKNFNKNNLFESQKENEEDFLYFFTDEELECIKFYKNHSSEPYYVTKNKYPDIAPDVRTMRNWMDILGNEYSSGALKKYHYNRTKFFNIETEEDAYWLGFITADGCIVENKHLQIKLAEKDREHLVKFCKYMELPDDEINQIIKSEVGGAYTKSNPVVCVKISSVDIITNLKDKGIEPRKSGKEKPYVCNSIELEKSYIRGLIDGDGYIRSTEYGLGIVGSYDICKYVFDFINVNIIDISNNHIREHGSIYKLELTGKNQSSKILQYLYKDNKICLDRKNDLYNKMYEVYCRV